MGNIQDHLDYVVWHPPQLFCGDFTPQDPIFGIPFFQQNCWVHQNHPSAKHHPRGINGDGFWQPCSPGFAIKIAGIYGRSSPKKMYLQDLLSLVIRRAYTQHIPNNKPLLGMVYYSVHHVKSLWMMSSTPKAHSMSRGQAHQGSCCWDRRQTEPCCTDVSGSTTGWIIACQEPTFLQAQEIPHGFVQKWGYL